MKTKTEIAVDAFNKKDYKEAFRICKTFRAGVTKEQRKLFERAYECHVRPDFYKSLGYNPTNEILKASIEFHLVFIQ